MGYTRVVQYGDLVEIYNYSKDVHPKKLRTHIRRSGQGYSKLHYRSRASLQRTRTSFIRRVYATLHAKGTPTFITLTHFQTVDLSVGYEHLRKFITNIRRFYPGFALICVPEWQKTGRLHFHCLVWGTDKEKDEKEAENRFYQAQWARGYVDVRLANDASVFLAFYLAKYMAKAHSDKRLFNQRAYSSTYNIEKSYSVGSNSMASKLSFIIPDDKELISEYNYETQYLGQCNVTKLKVKYDSKC